MQDEKNEKWDEYTISKEAIALVKGLQKQKEMLVAQLSMVDMQLQNMVGIIAQSFLGDDVAIPEGLGIKTDFENRKLMIERFERVPIRRPFTGPIGSED